MSTDTSKVIIHMVSSLDGFIEKKDRSVSWMDSTDTYENGVIEENEESDDFNKTKNCFVMGSRTYELALELSRDFGWAYGDVPTIVLTHRELPVERENIKFYSGDLEKLVDGRLKPEYDNIWVVGGAMVTREFIRHKLADNIRITIVPIILGDGTLFFDYVGQEQPLHLNDAKAYKNGMVALSYEIRKDVRMVTLNRGIKE